MRTKGPRPRPLPASTLWGLAGPSSDDVVGRGVGAQATSGPILDLELRLVVTETLKT